MGVQEIYQLAIAIGLGLMVGLEREGKRSDIAGIRTFPMTSEYAAMIMFMVGLALSQDWNALAVVASGVVLVLL